VVPPHLGIWFVASGVALLLAAVTAVALARRRVDYRPLALFLAGVVVAQFVRLALLVAVLQPATDAGRLPFSGWERAAFHLEQALFIAFPLGLTALAVRVLARWRAWPVAVVWLAAVAVLALGYPTIRRELLQSVYLAIELAALLVALVAAASWWKSSARGGPPDDAVLLCVAVELGAVGGPYAAGLIDVTWPIAQGLYTGLFLILFGLEVAWLRRR
jgi:hypothetical protein